RAGAGAEPAATHREEQEEEQRGAAAGHGGALSRGAHSAAAAALPGPASGARPTRRQGCGRSGFLEEGPPPPGAEGVEGPGRAAPGGRSPCGCRARRPRPEAEQRPAHAGRADPVPAARPVATQRTAAGVSRHRPHLAELRRRRAVPRRTARGRCPPRVPRQAGAGGAVGASRKWRQTGFGLRPRAAMAGLYRTVGVFGGFVAVVAAAFYPIYFRPLLMPEEYKKEQSVNRAGIVQEDIQPAGLKVWSDPFGRK
uniref:Small integral membrane protein 20 n=2 Tax=Strigops habroptila TaxID=2489341 RepID=A0A672V143_STRHB